MKDSGDQLKIQDKIKVRILKEIENREDEIIDFLRDLIRIPSITGEEVKAQKFIEKKFRSMGLEVDVFEPELEKLRGHPAFFETRSYMKYGYENRPNVIGQLRGDNNAKSLMLSGHIDVVSPEPISAWKHDPWGAEIEKGRLYGRGAGDMKAGIAAMIYALKSIRDSGIDLNGNITLQTTIEEEEGGVGGVLASLLRGYKSDAVIFIEPTRSQRKNYTISIACAGYLEFKVKVYGRSAPANIAHTGVNAITMILNIYSSLENLNRERQKRIDYPPAWKRYENMKGHVTTLNIGQIRGGDNSATVPDRAELVGKVGWPPGEDLVDIKREIEQVIEKTAAMDPWLRNNIKLEWTGIKANPHEQDINHAIVTTVKKYAEEISEEKVQFCGGEGICDARYYVLYANIPAINFGPVGVNLHRSDEYTEINSVTDVTKILALTVIDWCGYKS